MSVTIDRLHMAAKFRTREEAEKVANANNESEQDSGGDFVYVVESAIVGFVVAIYALPTEDEPKEFLGYL